MARPFKFTPEELQKKVDSYFRSIEDETLIKYDIVKTGVNAGMDLPIKVKKMPSIQGLCVHIGVSFQEFYKWVNSDLVANNDELFEIAKRATEKIQAMQIEGAGAGLYQPVIVSRLNSLKDVQEVTQTTIDADGKSPDEIAAAIQAIEEARRKKQ
jgi:hypothetical protein